MVFKGFIAAATAVALSATSAVAAPRSSAAAAQAAASMAPAAETVEGDSQVRRRNWFVLILVILAIIAGIIAATAGDGDNDQVSPG